jgi:hypothetical protein
MYFSTNFIILNIIRVRIIFGTGGIYISEKLHQLHVYIVTLNKKLKAMEEMKLQARDEFKAEPWYATTSIGS